MKCFELEDTLFVRNKWDCVDAGKKFSKKNYKTGIIEIIQRINTSRRPTVAWEIIKRKDFSINFAKYEQKSIKVKIRSIKHEISEIEKESAENFDY